MNWYVSLIYKKNNKLLGFDEILSSLNDKNFETILTNELKQLEPETKLIGFDELLSVLRIYWDHFIKNNVRIRTRKKNSLSFWNIFLSFLNMWISKTLKQSWLKI